MPITTLQQWQSLFTTAHWSLYSLPFMVMFIIFFAVYIQFSAQKNIGRKLWVIAFSFFFATMINQWGVVLLPLTTIFSWYLTKQMMLIEAGKKRKYVLAITIILELLPLAYLKYIQHQFLPPYDLSTYRNFFLHISSRKLYHRCLPQAF